MKVLVLFIHSAAEAKWFVETRFQCITCSETLEKHRALYCTADV